MVVHGDRPRSAFPVILAVRRSYELVLSGDRRLAGIVFPWMTALSAALFLLGWFELNLSDTIPRPLVPPLAFIIPAVAAVVSAIAGIAIAWHHVLLPNAVRTSLSRGLAYALRVASFFLLLVFVPFFAGAATSTSATDLTAPILTALGVFALNGYVVARLILTLPSIAVANPASAISSAWTLTRGNGWRLFSGGLLTVAPAAVFITYLMSTIDDAVGVVTPAAIAALTAMRGTIMWIAVAVMTATYASLAYRFFVEGRADLERGDLSSLRDEFK